MAHTETSPEQTFDPEKFRADLAAKTEEYAKNKYITYGLHSNREENEQKKARADELYPELLDDCADALLATDDKEGVMEIIRITLADYRYESGNELFPVGAKMNFYYDLALRLTQKDTLRAENEDLRSKIAVMQEQQTNMAALYRGAEPTEEGKRAHAEQTGNDPDQK